MMMNNENLFPTMLQSSCCSNLYGRLVIYPSLHCCMFAMSLSILSLCFHQAGGQVVNRRAQTKAHSVY
jgi:hypothetical protein